MNNTLAIGMDIGGTRTKSGLVDLVTGKVLHSMVQPTEKANADIFLEQAGNVIRYFRMLAAKEQRGIAGIGIGVPGFTGEGGVVVTTYGFLTFMENYALKSIIESEFSLPCSIDNDARVVSLGEALFGKGRNFRRVLTLTLGTGVGVGFVVNGRFQDSLPLSHMGGHMTVTNEDGHCYCGKSGCLEALVSASGIIKAASGLLKVRHSGSNNSSTFQPSAEDVFTAALEGNTEAFAIIDRTAAYLKTAISNYINLFAPDIIILGGGIAKGMTPYADKIGFSSTGDFITPACLLPPFPGYTVQIGVSTLGELAGMLGGAALFNHYMTMVPI